METSVHWRHQKELRRSEVSGEQRGREQLAEREASPAATLTVLPGP